jgi:hypothetical protein
VYPQREQNWELEGGFPNERAHQQEGSKFDSECPDLILFNDRPLVIRSVFGAVVMVLSGVVVDGGVGLLVRKTDEYGPRLTQP